MKVLNRSLMRKGLIDHFLSVDVPRAETLTIVVQREQMTPVQPVETGNLNRNQKPSTDDKGRRMCVFRLPMDQRCLLDKIAHQVRV